VRYIDLRFVIVGGDLRGADGLVARRSRSVAMDRYSLGRNFPLLERRRVNVEPIEKIPAPCNVGIQAIKQVRCNDVPRNDIR
jgi:hypothetical protein